MAQVSPDVKVLDPVQGDIAVLGNDSITELDIKATEYVPVIAAAGVFGVLVSTGAVAVLIFIAVLIRGRKKFAEFPFFVIVWHLTFANGLHISMVITTILPIMLLEVNSDAIWFIWGARLMELTEQASLYLTFLMTVNRFVVFVFPKVLYIFNRLSLMTISLIIWVYVGFIVYWNSTKGVTKKFNAKKISMQDVLLGSNTWTKFFTLCSTILPLVMLFMYGIIFVFIIKRRNTVQSRKQQRKDRSLLWQALAVTVALELTKLASLATPYITGSTWVLWVWTIFNYSTSIINQMINPVLFLTMNRMVRSVLLHFFSKNSIIDSSDNNNSSSGAVRRKTTKIIEAIRHFVVSISPGTHQKDTTFVI